MSCYHIFFIVKLCLFIFNRCDGEYQLFLKGSEIIEGQEQNVGYIYGMSLDQMQHATQASEGIFIFDKGKNEDNCPAQIFPDNFGNVNEEFMIIIPSSSIEYLKRKFGITERESYQVSVQFEVKHSYFDTLHKAIVKVLETMIKKLFPKQGDTTQPLPTGTHRVNSKCDDQLEILSIDDYSQLKALESILQSTPNMPYEEIKGPLLHFKAELYRNYRCHPDITKLLFDLLYHDKGVIVSPRNVVTHPKAHFLCVFHCSDCSTLAKAADITPKQNSDIELSMKDVEAVDYQLKFYFPKWPEVWRDMHIPIKGSVCVVSASRNQVRPSLHYILNYLYSAINFS